MREFSIEDRLKKVLKKLAKKDKSLYESLMNKIEEIIRCADVNHYKNLRRPLQHFKRVHIKGPYVLIFLYEANRNHVTFFDFDHHDSIYE